MRSTLDEGSENEGRALLARAQAVHVAMVSETGAPILRTFDAVVDDGFLVLHRSAAGEDLQAIGRFVVAGAREVVASISGSCSVSVQAEGVLERVGDPARRARALAALLARDQTGGGPLPLSPPVLQLPLDRVTCQLELGQDRPLAERVRVLEQLWQRGRPGDVEAIARLLARFPELGTPAFLRLPHDVHDRSLRLQCSLDDDEIEEVLPLLEGLYWLVGLTRAEIRATVGRSTARVAARDADGEIVAFARALSDGKCAWIYDVAVAEHLRNARLGAAVMGVLLDHPMVRSARHVRLSTRDAMPFYRRLGFCNLDEAPRYPWSSTEMIKSRAGARARSEAADETEPRIVAADERNDERPREAP